MDPQYISVVRSFSEFSSKEREKLRVYINGNLGTKNIPLFVKSDGHVTMKLFEVSVSDGHKINVECRTAFVPKRRVS
jgi:hypothetical protein